MTSFRTMRRNRQELSTAECEQILQQATSGVLSLIGDGGYPYGVPISHLYADRCLYFHSAVEGHKIDAIRGDARCSFCVIERDDVHPSEYTTYYRSVIAFGKVHIIEDKAEMLDTLRHLGRRFNPGNEESVEEEINKHKGHVLMLRMEIEHLTGKEAKELRNMIKK